MIFYLFDGCSTTELTSSSFDLEVSESNRRPTVCLLVVFAVNHSIERRFNYPSQLDDTR
jgi:hypothetical protein